MDADKELAEAYAEAESLGVLIHGEDSEGQPEKTAVCQALYEEGLLGAVCTAILNAELLAIKAHRQIARSTPEDLLCIADVVPRPKPGFESRPCVECGDEVTGGLIQGKRLRWCNGNCLRAWKKRKGR